jgi:hypothetical protein
MSSLASLDLGAIGNDTAGHGSSAPASGCHLEGDVPRLASAHVPGSTYDNGQETGARERSGTSSSMGYNMPLPRYDLACPHHLSVVPTETTHGTRPYDRMDTIGMSAMDGISQKSVVTEGHTIAQLPPS